MKHMILVPANISRSRRLGGDFFSWGDRLMTRPIALHYYPGERAYAWLLPIQWISWLNVSCEKKNFWKSENASPHFSPVRRRAYTHLLRPDFWSAMPLFRSLLTILSCDSTQIVTILPFCGLKAAIFLFGFLFVYFIFYFYFFYF